MKNNNRIRAITAGIGLALGASLALGITSPAQAATYTMSWQGLFTWTSSEGLSMINTGLPDFYDPEWGYGHRTKISGSLTYDTATGTGSATLVPFDLLYHPIYFSTPQNITLQAIGDGFGGEGSLVLGNMLIDWGGNVGMPLSIVWDAAGLFGALGSTGVGDTITGVGAVPASNGIKNGLYPIGPAPLATTTWNTTPLCVPGGGVTGECMGVSPSGGLPLFDDGVGGSPILAGPFESYRFNFDVTSFTVQEVSEVPLPAALWLLGSGLVGLLGLARRRSQHGGS